MPKLTIYDRKGKKVGTYNVEPTDFAPRINKQLLHDAVVMYQANLARARTRRSRAAWSPARPRRCIARRARATPAPARSEAASAAAAGTSIASTIATIAIACRARRCSGHADGAGRQGSRRRADGDRRLGVRRTADQGHGRDPQAPRLPKGESLLVATAKHDANVYRSARNIAGVSVSPAGDLNALSVLSSRGCW